MTETDDVDVTVSLDERKALSEIVSAELSKLAKSPDVQLGPLWHYTTAENALKIIESGELWATHVGCVNDSTETTRAVSVLELELEKRSLVSDPDECRFYGLFREELARRNQKQDLLKSRFYIACLSEEEDDLSQWRAYGSGEGGVALGFVAESLPNTKESRILRKVIYEEDEQITIIRSLCDATWKAYTFHRLDKRPEDLERWGRGFFRAWFTRFQFLAPTMKNPAFRGEREWRLIQRVDSNPMTLEFRQKNSMITRHCPITFGKSSGRKRAPLIAVRIGPSRHREVSAESITALLNARKYPDTIEVSCSPIPYQTH